MYAALFKVAVLAPVAVLLALFGEPLLGHIAETIAMAPGGEETRMYSWTVAIADNILFFLLLSLAVVLLAAAIAEQQRAGGI
jgi:hypothetical protein